MATMAGAMMASTTEEDENAHADASIRIGDQDARQFPSGVAASAQSSERPWAFGIGFCPEAGVEACALSAHSITTRGSRTP